MNKKPAKMGRPTVPPDQKRSENVRLLLTPPEWEALSKAAAEADQTPSAWARERIIRAVRRLK